MKKTITSFVAACLIGAPFLAKAENFLSVNENMLKPSERMAGDLVYYPADIGERLPRYNSLMVDEPVIFLAPDSKYKGFKASDLAAISDMLRKSFMKGLSEQPISTGKFNIVEEPGENVLFVRMALKDVYVQKEKRGLFSYTPVGMVAHGVADIASDAIDKTTLVELKVEVEGLDSNSGEVLFAVILDRGHRKNKKAHQKQEEATWDAPGSVAEKLGRRLACSLDNAHLVTDKQVDCVKTIPIEE